MRVARYELQHAKPELSINQTFLEREIGREISVIIQTDAQAPLQASIINKVCYGT